MKQSVRVFGAMGIWGALSALGIALVLLVGLLVVRTMQNRSSDEPRRLFDAAEEASVVRFEVASQGEGVVLEKQAGVWVVLPEGIPVDTARVGNALRPVLMLVEGEQVSTSTDEFRLQEFGLDSASAKHVKWKLASDETRHVLLGNTSAADFNATFWKHPDRPGVYLTPGNFTHDIPSSSRVWMEIRVAPPSSPSSPSSPGMPGTPQIIQ